MLLGGALRARRPGPRAPAWRGRGGRPAPTPTRARACPARRRRRRRSPGRRTTATPRWALWARTTRLRVRAAVGVEQHRQRRAVVVGGQQHGGGDAGARRGTTGGRRRAPTGVAACDASSTPSSVSHCAPGSASVAVRTTTVPPPAATACTPGSSVSASSSPSGVRRQTWSTVASSIGLARNTIAGAVDASATARTCRSGGVTGSPSTSSRRAPSRSAHVTSAPSGRRRGHAGHELDPLRRPCPPSARSVAPVAGSTSSTSTVRWSRRCTVMIRPSSVQCTSARYGNALAVPLDVDDAAVEADDVQRDVGVRRCPPPGRPARSAASPGRPDRRCASAGTGAVSTRATASAVAVGAPPVAAEAVHLLGGDELGAAPRDALGLVGRRRRARRQRPSSSPMHSRRPLT